MSAAEPSRPAEPNRPADARIPRVCCDGHREFLALAEWPIRCRSCDPAGKVGRAAPAFAAEVERLQAENAALRQALARAREDVARWRRIAHAAQAAPRKRPARTPPSPSPIPAEPWRRIVQCGPPDRHGGRVSAVEAPRGLLEHRS